MGKAPWPAARYPGRGLCLLHDAIECLVRHHGGRRHIHIGLRPRARSFSRGQMVRRSRADFQRRPRAGDSRLQLPLGRDDLQDRFHPLGRIRENGRRRRR